MVLSDISIKRPVLAVVISLLLVLAGLFGFRQLSVREFPDVDPPVISINTTYRGASAEIIENQVTQVIEDAVAGIEGIRTITSSSREESSSVNIEFVLERDVEAAANDVRDRVARVIETLPDETDPPQVAKTDADARPILWLTLTSDRLSGIELTDYAERFLVDRFSTVPGVASVTLGGGQRAAMRIDLDRGAMAARSLTVQDIENAIRRENMDLPSGRIEGKMREFSVMTESSLRTPDEFRALVVRERDGALTRLGEVAQVEIGAENNRTEFRAQGRGSVGIGIIRQSKSNSLEVARGVKAVLAAVRPTLPAEVSLDTSYDQSIFIEGSINEVYRALAIALALVIGVIFVFLRSWRATLIPALAIPVSIIASLTVLAALGFSVNVLTLLALVLAIGIVVDDAIVVLENIHRRIELGEPPLLASLRGARQIGFAVIATTAVLIAVFVPISLLSGGTGRLFREFGVSVAAAVAFSGLVALTLTPMMCSKLLRPVSGDTRFVRLTEHYFDTMTARYRVWLASALDRPKRVLAIAGAVTLAGVLIFMTIPREFSPTEDRGYFFIDVQAPEGSSFDYTRRYVLEIEDRLKPLAAQGGISRVLTIVAPAFSRISPVNTAFGIVRLDDWGERDVEQADLVRTVNRSLKDLTGARAIAINPAGLGQRGFAPPVEILLLGSNYREIDRWADALIEKASQNPKLLNVNKNYQETRPELRVHIDRDRAADLGISVETIGRTLETMLGSRFVGTFQRDGKLYNVVVQARREDRLSPQDLSSVYVPVDRGERLVPLSNLVSLDEAAGARELVRVNRLRSIKISAALQQDYTLGEALDYMEDLAASTLPPEAQIGYAGQSRDYREASSASYFTFGLALLVVFLTLAAQFESFIHPLIILTVVPLAVTGALASMFLLGGSLNIYSQIGIIMLIGLTAKNAILIVEFANQLRDQGQELRAAVSEAAAVRLRPILMTSIATMFGALPLALATGAGAEAREALGVVVFGGVGFATLLSLFLVPVVYQMMAPYTKPSGTIARRLSDLEARHPHIHADAADEDPRKAAE
jgi:multidrug efflux pump